MELEEPDCHAPLAQPMLDSTLCIIANRSYGHVKDMVKLRLRLGLAIRPQVKASALGGARLGHFVSSWRTTHLRRVRRHALWGGHRRLGTTPAGAPGMRGAGY